MILKDQRLAVLQQDQALLFGAMRSVMQAVGDLTQVIRS